MRTAPPILGPLEFFGLKNNIILVEHDYEDCSIELLRDALKRSLVIFFSPVEVGINNSIHAGIFTQSISKVRKIILSLKDTQVDFYVINRIDMMDEQLGKRERGAQMKAYISMLCSDKILSEANVVITSSNSEYSIREIANRYINLRK